MFRRVDGDSKSAVAKVLIPWYTSRDAYWEKETSSSSSKLTIHLEQSYSAVKDRGGPVTGESRARPSGNTSGMDVA